MHSMLTSQFLTCIQFSVSSCTGIVIGIGIGQWQYYWVLGALFGIVLTLVSSVIHIISHAIAIFDDFKTLVSHSTV